MSQGNTMDNIERWECVECGRTVPDERGHVHVTADDAYRSSPARLVVYVSEQHLQGAVSRIAGLEAEVARLERDRSNLAKSALAHRKAGREEGRAARGR